MMMDKEKALDNALAQIEKQFGKGAIMRLGDQSAHMEVSAIPTGCLEVDLALGIDVYKRQDEYGAGSLPDNHPAGACRCVVF